MDDLSVCASVDLSDCPGHLGQTGPGMRQVVEFGIHPREGVLLGANLGCAVVTIGVFTAYILLWTNLLLLLSDKSLYILHFTLKAKVVGGVQCLCCPRTHCLILI